MPIPLFFFLFFFSLHNLPLFLSSHLVTPSFSNTKKPFPLSPLQRKTPIPSDMHTYTCELCQVETAANLTLTPALHPFFPLFLYSIRLGSLPFISLVVGYVCIHTHTQLYTFPFRIDDQIDVYIYSTFILWFR